MDRTTKKATDRVHKHREDGEEAVKRAGKVVPIDSGKDNKSVQVASESKPEKNERVRGESE